MQLNQMKEKLFEHYNNLYHSGALMAINDIHKIKHATNDELYSMSKKIFNDQKEIYQ